MPFRNFVNGSLLDAETVNRFWLQQAHVIKTVDETVTSSATLQDDNELVLPVLANTDYWLECQILYGAPINADMKITFSAPTGTVFDLLHNGLRTGHNPADPTPVGRGIDFVSRARLQVSSTGGEPGGCSDAGTNNEIAVCPVEGRVIVGANAGNFRLRWSQETSQATGTVVKANSLMILQRLTE